jgi:purine-binding chemotaxis protein CheW
MGQSLTEIPNPPALVGGKYLTFRLGGEEFALAVGQVREIIGRQTVTRVPHAPALVEGVINLRGKVIPVVDLGRSFGFLAGQGEADPSRASIVVVELPSDKFPAKTGAKGRESVLAGILVDEVTDVLTLQTEEMEPNPSLGASASACVVGLAKVKDKVKIVLDVAAALRGANL